MKEEHSPNQEPFNDKEGATPGFFTISTETLREVRDTLAMGIATPFPHYKLLHDQTRTLYRNLPIPLKEGAQVSVELNTSEVNFISGLLESRIYKFSNGHVAAARRATALRQAEWELNMQSIKSGDSMGSNFKKLLERSKLL